MMPLRFTRNIQNLNRLRQIATTLTQHGFGHVVDQIDLRRFVPVWIRRREPVPSAMTEDSLTSIGRRLKQVCIELGPTFIKLGQVVSARPGAAPAEVLAELRGLQDDVDAFDPAVAKSIIKEELGKDVSECFAEFEDRPAASGSIGQVHFARTHGGADVVVKVRRPEIEKTIKHDVQLLHWIAESVESLLPELKVYQPVMIAHELEQLLTRELDYVNEASTTQRFHHAFEDVEDVRIPAVYWDLTAPRVLTLERLAGESIDNFLDGDDARHPSVSRRRLASVLAETFLTQVFDIGIFHADPHPGNILIDQRGKLGLIDFGQIGTITDEFLTELIVLVSACINSQIELTLDTMIDMGAVGPRADHRRIERALRELVDKYSGLPVHRIDPVQVLLEFIDTTRGADVRIPREISQLTKALSTLASVVSRLDPNLDLATLIRPRLRRAFRERLSPSQLSKASARFGWDILTVFRKAPRRIRAVLRNLGTGLWQLQVRHENIDRLIKELDRSSNRLAFSIVIAAIIVGSSVVVSAETDLTVIGFKFQYFGIAGYLFAALLGLALAWAIFRSGRLH